MIDLIQEKTSIIYDSSKNISVELNKNGKRAKEEHNAPWSMPGEGLRETAVHFGLVNENGEANKTAIAKLLGTSRKTIDRWMKPAGPNMGKYNFFMLGELCRLMIEEKILKGIYEDWKFSGLDCEEGRKKYFDVAHKNVTHFRLKRDGISSFPVE